MNKLIVLGSYLINPLLGIILTLKNIKKRNLFILGLSLGIGFYSFNYNPRETADLYRHYKYFDEIVQVGNFDPFGTQYFGMYILCYMIKILGLNKRVLAFITAFVSYYIMLKLVLESSRKLTKDKEFLLNILFFLILGTNYLNLVSGVRWGISSSIFLYGIEKYFGKRIKLIQIMPYFFIAICMHQNILILILIFVLSEIIKIPFKNKVCIRILVGFFIFYTALKYVNLSTIKFDLIPQINRKMKTYFGDGKWGEGYYLIILKSSNILGKLKVLIKRIIDTFFPIIYILKSIKSNTNYFKKEYNFIFMLFYIELFLFKYFALFDRLKYTLIILVCLDIIRNYKTKNKIIMKLAIIFVVFFRIIFNWRRLNYFVIPFVKMIFSIPLLKILGII